MKKKILLIVFICSMMQVLITGKAIGQTSVHINYAFDSTYIHCPVPITTDLFVYGSTHGYPTGDSVNIHFYFGDGTDTSYWYQMYSDTSFWAYAQHTYMSAGTFSAKYVATGPDGASDSVTNMNQLTLGDTCGNISGRVYLDNNGNCVYDAGDSILRGYPVELLFGATVIGWSFTDLNGDYWFSPPTGQTYTVRPVDQTAYGFQVNCPTSGDYSINLVSTSYGNDFGLSCLNGYDMAGYMWGWHFRPGFDSYMDLSAFNLRCQPTSGTVKLVLDPLVSYVSSYYGPTPTISGDTLIWNYSNFANNYNYYWYWNWYNNNEFYAYMTLHTSSNAVLGDSVCFTLIVDPINGDADPSNNTVHMCRPVSNSCDPNMKGVNPIGIGPNGDIAPNQKLTYTIHFQNVGNDTAYSVSVYDTLSANLDVNTFAVLNSDHTFTTEMLPNNIVKFNFNNIMLPDSITNPITSQGQITYTIKPKAGLPDGTFIYNNAGIVFDFNNPIITNQTRNRINLALGINEIKNTVSIASIYPNPAINELNINLHTQKATEIKLMDAIGNVVMTFRDVKTNLVLNTSKLTSGIYTLSVNNSETTQREKVIIIH